MTRVNELQIINSATFNSAFIVTHSGATTPVPGTDQLLTRRISYPSLLQQIRAEVVSSDQALYTTSTVRWNSSSATTSISKYLDVSQAASIGGSPSSSTNYSLFIDNTISPFETAIGIRGYGANYPSTISNEIIPNSPTVIGSYANMSQGVKFAAADQDKLFVLGSGGYSGNSWHTPTGELTFYAQGTWQDNGLTGVINTASNVGTSFVLKSYPPNAPRHTATTATIDQIKSHIIQGWVTENNIPLTDMLVGSGIGNDSSSILKRNDGTVYTSFGATKFTFVNSRVRIDGVPRESLSYYDNLSLLDSNALTFVANRGGAASGRRNAIENGDTLGRIEFRGQISNSATIASIGNIGGEISVKALDNFSSSANGSKFVLTTINSGTTTASNRLELQNNLHIYSSDYHAFKSNSGQTLAVLSTGSFTVYTSAVFPNGVLPNRVSLTTSTGTIPPGSTSTIQLSAYKTYALSKLTVTYPARIRIYSDSASRLADATRAETTASVQVTGMIAEIITTVGGSIKLFTPAVIGFNNDSPSSTTMYLSIVNKDVLSRDITMGFTLLQMEQ
jgi:hypothetical protein